MSDDFRGAESFITDMLICVSYVNANKFKILHQGALFMDQSDGCL